MIESQGEDRIIEILLEGSDEARSKVQLSILDTDSGIDVKALRQHILDTLESRYPMGKIRTSDPWGPRSWLTSTLAIIARDDRSLIDYILKRTHPKQEPEIWIRYWVLASLFAGGSKFANEIALEYSSLDSHPLVKCLADAILAYGGDKTAEHRLLGNLKSERDKYPAIRAVRVVPIPKATEPVLEFVELEPSKPGFNSALVALGHLPDNERRKDRVRGVLLGVASQQGGSAWERYRITALESLTKLPEPSLAEKLLPFLTDSSLNVVRAAARALEKSVSIPDAVKMIVNATEPSTVRTYASALRSMDSDVVVEELANVLEKGSGRDYSKAEDLLREIGGEEAISILMERSGTKALPAVELKTASMDDESQAPRSSDGFGDYHIGRKWLYIGSPLGVDRSSNNYVLNYNLLGSDEARVNSENLRRGDLLLDASGGALHAIHRVLENQTKVVKGDPVVLLELRLELNDYVSLTDLAQAAPKLVLNQNEPPALSRVQESAWAVIREIMAHYNPSLSEKLPTSTVEPIRRSRVDNFSLPDSAETEIMFFFDLIVRNVGNVVWPSGDRAHIQIRGPKESGLEVTIVQQLSYPVHPEGTAVFKELELRAPSEGGRYRLECAVSIGDSDDFEALPGHAILGVIPPKADYALPSNDSSDKPINDETPPQEPEVDAQEAGRTETQNIKEMAEGLEAETPEATQRRLPDAGSAGILDETPRHMLASAAPIVIAVPTYTPPPHGNKATLLISKKEARLNFEETDYVSPLELDLANLKGKPTPREYGEELFRTVINTKTVGEGEHDSTYKGFLLATEKTKGRLRFEVHFEDDAQDLRELRWECLRNPRKTLPLAINQHAPFYRRVPSKSVSAAKPPIRILAAIANPVTLGKGGGSLIGGLEPLDGGVQRRILDDGLQTLADAGLAKYDVLCRNGPGTEVTLDRLAKALKKPYHVLHLVAHGVVAARDYQIVLEKDDGTHDFVPSEELAAAIPGAGRRLVILAACWSATRQTETRIQGLGPRLTRAGVPAVISMQDALDLDSAQLFTQHFYDDLARSGRVDMALAATRHAIYLRKGADSWDWTVPVLEMHSLSGKLFEPHEKAATLPPRSPRIRTREELFPHADEELARRIEDQARRQGASEKQLAGIREAVQKEVSEVMTRDRAAEGLSPPQDRVVITRALTKPVRISASDLRNWIEDSDRGLVLPVEVYNRVASVLNAGKHLVLIGPPGTGKTTVAHMICAFAQDRKLSLGTTPATASADWTTFDTVGGYVPTEDQCLAFRQGIFLRSICSATWLAIDEINRADIDKAVGELFTVLAGQAVDLPYRVADQPVRVLPAGSRDVAAWMPDRKLSPFDYVVHPNWRIVATMNVYDKSSLFAMSFAFMRRFAFVDVGIPREEDFRRLRHRWIKAGGLEEAEDSNLLEKDLAAIFKAGSKLMRRRELGPAIARDMIAFIADRRSQEGISLRELVGEAFLMYAVPQLDGLDREGIRLIYEELQVTLEGIGTAEEVFARIKSLYPHIPADDWPDGSQKGDSDEN